MDINKLPDNETKPLNIEVVFTTQKRRYAILIAALMLINIVLFIIFSMQEGNITQKLYLGIKIIGAGSFLVGFGLGLITALIPYKKFQYGEKYF